MCFIHLKAVRINKQFLRTIMFNTRITNKLQKKKLRADKQNRIRNLQLDCLNS